jgi:hypothetical protein
LLRIPDSIPKPVVAIGAMLVLAALDIAGALLARRWAHGGQWLWFLAGVACFAVLFWVYGSSLRYADLVPVTFGWIVSLQVGLLAIDRVSRGRSISLPQIGAAGVIILLEGYLLLSSNSS